MNYVCAVYGVVVFIVMVYWFVRGKSTFRTKDERHVDAEVDLAAVGSAPVAHV
jgi:choline transport protein